MGLSFVVFDIVFDWNVFVGRDFSSWDFDFHIMNYIGCWTRFRIRKHTEMYNSACIYMHNFTNQYVSVSKVSLTLNNLKYITDRDVLHHLHPASEGSIRVSLTKGGAWRCFCLGKVFSNKVILLGNARKQRMIWSLKAFHPRWRRWRCKKHVKNWKIN